MNILVIIALDTVGTKPDVELTTQHNWSDSLTWRALA